VAVADKAYEALARAGAKVPAARPKWHGLERIEDVPYDQNGPAERRLDIYRPLGGKTPRPVVLYAHGGAFRALSKDTHWLMGLAFARRGYLVFNVDYRLAPQHRYPAAIEDVCAAYEFVVENAELWGGDPSRLILAGESAGANLVTAATVAACYERPEPWARRAFDTGVAPTATLPACGIFDVSGAADLWRRRELPWFLIDQLETCMEYLPDNHDGLDLDLADPLRVFERGDKPDRPLPHFYVPVGTRDPLLHQTRRLRSALEHMGVSVKAEFFEGEVHAFHAFVWRRKARDCWRSMFEFLDAV